MTSSLAQIGRIPLDLRIGVTGHRWIPDTESTRAVVRSALDSVISQHATQTMRATTTGITIVSALADGADRLVALVGLELGARLEVVLPLAVADYERDFRDAASVQEFRTLLASASTVDVVPSTLTRDHHYSAAGREMVDRSDVLIALYDGEQARGLGGTGEIVDYARDVNLPTVIVPAVRGAEAALHPPADTIDLAGVPLTAKALGYLDRFNAADLRDREQQRAARALQRDPDQPLLPYYLRADELALRYQRWHVFAVLGLYAFSAVAVAAVAFQSVFFAEDYQLGWIEFAALVIVLWLALRRLKSLGRWTSARFIAERLRSAMFVSRTGTVPTFATIPGGADEWSGVDWAGRAIREVWFRTVTAQAASLDADLGTAVQWIDTEWVRPQLDYHRRAQQRWSFRQKVFARAAIVLFALSLASSLAHSLHAVPADWPDITVFVSTTVPAIGAAVSGYAAQREFGRQAMRSGHAMRELSRLQFALNAAQTPEEVRTLVIQLDTLMHGDAAEWYVSASLHDEQLPG